jgi:hypothetical protein
VGYIRLNEKRRGAQHYSCRLIELSRGLTTWSDGFKDRYAEYDYSEELKMWEHEPYEFVNVMWITMNGNFAERRAVGRVQMRAWEQLPREKVRVTIG